MPDTKDWTWVVDRSCPECGFDPAAGVPSQIPGLVRGNADAWSVIHRQGALTSARPRPDRWSPLEYACHLRDVYWVFDGRFEMMLAEVDPEFPNWDGDAAAVEARYDQQDPGVVVDELQAAAQAVADRLDRVADDEWDRTGRRCDGFSFTVATLGQYMAHEAVHHLWDVTGSPVKRGEGA